MQLAEKVSSIGTESAFEVLAKARALEKQGKNIVHLEIGEPDFPTPAHVIEAGKRALDEGWTKYGPTPGFPEFREAIAAYGSRTRNIRVGAIPNQDHARIADMLRDRDLMIISEEIYSRGFYETEPASTTGFDGMVEKTIILDGFSKTYSMTGWRLGDGVMPKWLADAVTL